MKSIPASSAMRARRRQYGQLADHRSGTLVAERPDEQFAPKITILSAVPLYMAMRSCINAVRANTASQLSHARALTRASIFFAIRLLVKRMDCRVKPGQARL